MMNLQATGKSSSILLILALLSMGNWTPALDWPEWRGAGRRGVWEGVKLPGTLNSATVKKQWQVAIGGGFSGIAVAGAAVFTMDRPGKENRERVLCFDRESGNRLWVHEYGADYGDMDYPNGPRSTPTLEGGRLFTLGAAGHVHCLEVKSGKVLWAKDVVKEFGAKLPQWGHAASPLVIEGNICFQVGGRPGATIMAFDKESGAERWRALDDRPSYSSPIALEWHGKKQVVVWTADSIVGLAAASGACLWRVEYKSTYDVAIMSPVHFDGLLLVSGYWEGSKALRLEEDGEPRVAWEGKHLSCLMSTPLWREGFLYALDKDEGLLCLEWKSGKILWKDDHKLTPKARNPQASLVWAGSKAVALNELGELILAKLSPSGYEELGRRSIIEKTWAHPAFAGQDVYARSDTTLVCVRLKEGP